MLNRLILLGVSILLISSCSKGQLQVEEGYFISQGDSIYYKSVGQGDPLIVIHGGPVLDHVYMIDHFQNLAKDYQVIFYDQRVCGNSQVEIPGERITFNAFVEDIEGLREHLNLDKTSILGHSWGGLIAMKYALAHDDRINHLILSNSMAPSAKEWDRENVAVAERYTKEDQDQLNKLASSGLLRSKEAGPYIEEMMLLSYKAQFYDKAHMEKLHLNIPNDYALRSSIFMNLSKELANYDLMDSLSRVSSPTLIVYGEIEPAVDFYLSKFQRAFPDAQSAVIERSGHFPFVEQSEKYDQIISEFLEN